MIELKQKLVDGMNHFYGVALGKHERNIIDMVLNSKEFGQTVSNKRPMSIKRIGFLLFSLQKYSGGTTSILRLASGLSDLKYEISYVVYNNQSIKELEENARFNLSGYKGKIKKYTDCKSDEFDVVIATSWMSSYKLNDYNAYKMYFVQDFEPYFFKVNERYYLAKTTYELGYHIVSLGKWNVNQIKKECLHTTSKLDYVDFPYEKSEYQYQQRDYKTYSAKRIFSLAVYVKEEGKRIPNIILYILKKASQDLKNEGIELDINLFGLSNRYKPIIGKNLGKLNKAELHELYKRCDFGMVASMTNISLVPYEMLATGLPVFEMKAGSFSDFLGNESAMLIDFDYHSFVNRIKEVISEPRLIEEMISSAQKKMVSLSWPNTCRQFADIMEGK